MSNPPPFTNSIWFVSLVALLVALGAEVLIGALTPITTFDWLFSEPRRDPVVIIAGETSFWREDSMIRALSFGIGAFVACLLASRHSWLLLASLVAVAVVATTFAQLPRPATFWQLTLWASAAPLGTLLVGVSFHAWRRGA
jgi:hypothetical protein